MDRLRIAVLSSLTFLITVSPALAAIRLEPVLTGLSSPLYVTHAHDSTNRLFVVEQPGRIKVLQPGATTPTVFLDITLKVLSGGERGLLGLAFHPQYATNRRFFVNYTRQTDGATVIAEYRASAPNSNVADTAETVLLVIPQPFANHNGGMIEFGPDGFLYIGMGDGGFGNDPDNHAQNIDDLLGKILRIDINVPNPPLLYSSPSTNPFFGATVPGADEIYAVGFRNPWRFSFDRTTGQLIVADVGQSAREEIDIVTLGGNYGWRVFEGTLCTGLGPASCSSGGFIAPIAEYDHTEGCSITGGYVYRGMRGALPVGAYVFGDFCSGEIRQLLPVASGGTQTVLLDTALSISSFGEDEAGEIYVVDLVGGTVDRITSSSSPPPPAPGASPAGGGGGPCFIATAAFGSPLTAEVQVLREFRDTVLLPHTPGRLFVSAYYATSPPLARLIAANDTARKVTRTALRPIIWGAHFTLISPVLAAALAGGALATGLLLPLLLFRPRRRLTVRDGDPTP